jgi:4-aminobutyrate aminotransferase-like enzyme
MSTGHSHPAITQVIREQAEVLLHIGNRFTNRARVLLAERLAALVPDPLGVSCFCSTGSEANEIAFRIARLVTARFEIVAVARGYHGRTSTAYGASSSVRRMRRGAGPPPPGIVLADPPYPFRCPFSCVSCDLRCWRHSAEIIDRASSGEPAAVIMEFVIGAGGGIIPVPAEWAREVRRFCDERGALLIADEALTGLGRTGRWFAFEHSGVVPDIVVISKALGGGVPAAAVITTRSAADAALARGFVQAASHQGDPFQCAVALANLTVMEQESLPANAQVTAAEIDEALSTMSAALEEAEASWQR